MPYENQFAALSHPLRQSILTALNQTPASVRELTDQMPASQPVVSQHLKILREAGLVTVTAHGKRNIYRIAPDGLDQLRAFLEQHWLLTLKGLDAHDD